MTPKIETSIWLALKSRVDVLMPEYAKAYPAEKFTPPFGAGALLPYLRIGRVSAAPARKLIANGQGYQRTGFLMVTLVAPLGQDVAVYDQIAGSIAEHFNDTVKMQHNGLCVSIPSYPQVNEGYEENGYWTVPVRVPWRCFA